MNSLKEKIALVTGAGAGIGHAICKELAAMGATVIAVARNKDKLAALKTSLPAGDHQYWPIDLSQPQGHDALLSKLKEFSLPHIVVINLHIPTGKRKLANTSGESFSNNISANILHALAIMPDTIAFQRAEKFGRWIGLSSFAAQVGIPGQGIYNAQKSMLESVMRNIAAEEGKYHITANVIAPGFIVTPSVEDRISPDMIQMAATCNVMKRAGTADEVAAAAGFLASPGASYITGITLPVCGGAQLAWNFV